MAQQLLIKGVSLTRAHERERTVSRRHTIMGAPVRSHDVCASARVCRAISPRREDSHGCVRVNEVPYEYWMQAAEPINQRAARRRDKSS